MSQVQEKKLFLTGGFTGVRWCWHCFGKGDVFPMCLGGLCVFLLGIFTLSTRWIEVWSACEPLENCEHLMDSIEYLVPLGSNFEMPFLHIGMNHLESS